MESLYTERETLIAGMASLQNLSKNTSQHRHLFCVKKMFAKHSLFEDRHQQDIWSHACCYCYVSKIVLDI